MRDQLDGMFIFLLDRPDVRAWMLSVRFLIQDLNGGYGPRSWLGPWLLDQLLNRLADMLRFWYADIRLEMYGLFVRIKPQEGPLREVVVAIVIRSH